MKSLSLNFNQISDVNELKKVNIGIRELNIKSNPGLIIDKKFAMNMFPKLKILNGETVRESTKPPMP